MHACDPLPLVGRGGDVSTDRRVGPAAAATCADLPVTARGDASRFEVLAKAKARGDWRAKVRALPALGAAYADWYKALAAEYRCSQKDGRTCAPPSRTPVGD